jgi:hypothetical protein
MFWFTSRDGTRFLVQTPCECAQSLTLAFSDPDAEVTSQRFMHQVTAECPPPERIRSEKPAGQARA